MLRPPTPGMENRIPNVLCPTITLGLWRSSNGPNAGFARVVLAIGAFTDHPILGASSFAGGVLFEFLISLD